MAVNGALRVARGVVNVERVGDRSVLVGLRGESPLKLLTPRYGRKAAWVIAGTYGGGLVAGDRIALNVSAGDGTVLFIGTQASTKVYRAVDGVGCEQELVAEVGAGAVCVIAPDPVTPFAEAVYEQRQRVCLHEQGSAVLVDWLTSGRSARGERWAFSRYSTRTDVMMAGRLLARDALRLDASDGRLDAFCRTGGMDCLATVLIAGPAVRGAAEEILAWIANRPIGRREAVVYSGSPLRFGAGAILRVAGVGPEAVGRWIRERLGFVGELLGEDPWARKW